MFTGLVTAVGTIREARWVSSPAGKGMVWSVQTPYRSLKVRQSVAVEGVCLTVLQSRKGKKGSEFRAEISEETLKKTTLGFLKKGTAVNLEEALRSGDRLGGHFVQGHVDGMGKILNVEEQGQSRLYTFSCPAELEPYLIPKGSVAVNGISLTIVEVLKNAFTVSILPFTEEQTSLSRRRLGDPVNLEADLLAKLVVKQARNFLEALKVRSGGLFQKIELEWEALTREVPE